MAQQETFIYGKHAVREAVKRNPDAIIEIFLTATFDDIETLKEIKNKQVNVTMLAEGKMPKGFMDSFSEKNSSVTHQGIIAKIHVSRLVGSYKDFIQNLESSGGINPETALVVLGELQDPQNVGAIIRSAAAFGIKAVLLPEHNYKQAQITGTVVKVSAGTAFSIPLISIGNVNATLRDLKSKGFWIYGLDGEAEQSIVNESFEAPSVFVLGNEAEGIRLKTQEECDILLSIPMTDKAESLNVSASAAVTFYAWRSKQKGI